MVSCSAGSSPARSFRARWLNWYSIGLESRHVGLIPLWGFDSLTRRVLPPWSNWSVTLDSQSGDGGSSPLGGIICRHHMPVKRTAVS